MRQHIDISHRIAEFFPVGGRPTELVLVPSSPTGEWPRGQVLTPVARFQLISWERSDEGVDRICDMKEQELFMGWPAWYDDRERIRNFFAALGAVLIEIPAENVVTLMPSDVVLTDALQLKRARTREDFDAALRAKSRLGRYLVRDAAD